MPYLNSSSTDLQPVQAGGGSFSGGQFSAARQSIIPDDAYGEGINVDNDEYGNAITCRGSTRVYTSGTVFSGPIQGITQFVTNTVVSANGALYSDNAGNGVWVAYPISGTAFPVQTGNSVKVNFATGNGTLYAVNGINNLWSMSPTGVGATISGATNTDPPPAPRDVSWHTSRLVLLAGDSDPVGLYFSQFLTGGAGQWNRSLWSFQVGSSNDPATGILSWSNQDLLVMKQRSLYVVNCNPTYAVTDFTVIPIHKNLGCIAPRTAAQCGTDILLLTRVGVIKIDRSMATDTSTEIRDPVSKPIQDVINRINWAAVKDNAAGYYWNNRYFLSVPLDTDTTNVTTLVYNTVTDKWMGSWGKTKDAHCFSRNDGLSPARLRWGRFDGKVYEWLDYVKETEEAQFDNSLPAWAMNDPLRPGGPITAPVPNNGAYQDNGVDIPTSIVSKSYDFSEPDSFKDLSTIKLEFFKSTSNVDIGIRLDGGLTRTILTGFSTLADTTPLPRLLPFTLPHPGIKPKKIDLSNQPPCFEVAAVITAPAGKTVVRKVVFSATVSSMGVEVAEAATV